MRDDGEAATARLLLQQDVEARRAALRPAFLRRMGWTTAVALAVAVVGVAAGLPVDTVATVSLCVVLGVGAAILGSAAGERSFLRIAGESTRDPATHGVVVSESPDGLWVTVDVGGRVIDGSPLGRRATVPDGSRCTAFGAAPRADFVVVVPADDGAATVFVLSKTQPGTRRG